MPNDNIMNFFSILHSSTEILQKELDMPYLEALVETGENILDGKTPRVIDGKPGEEAVFDLQKLYQSVQLEEMTSEEIRSGLQLAVLKGMKEDYVQPNHQMTPDAIGLLMVYFVRIFLPDDKQSLRVLDLAAGTGNLLTVLYNHLSQDGREIAAEGIDNDDLLLSIAAVSTSLQRIEAIRLTHQDALTNLLVEPADLVISDLPVGYYPVQTTVSHYETAFEEGNSYSHHLLIEQSLNYLRESGYAFFLVPANLFQTDEAKSLLTFIQKESFFQGLIQLPDDFFKNEHSRKSILVLQKKGPNATQAKEVLLAKAPDFRDGEALKRFLSEVTEWKNENLL